MQTEKQHGMISSDQVEGTDVYGTNGDHVGTINHLLIDRQSGKIAYAVMGFGGFMGIGEDHHPIPWAGLSYDPGVGGYVTGITREQLEGAPARSEGWQQNRDWEEQTYRHYGLPNYWI